MCVTAIAEAKNAQQLIYEQVKNVKEQQKLGVPSENIRIRCGCLKYVNWLYMHRCLYCSVFFCKTCAEEHFGKTIEQYRDENPLHT